MTEFETLIKVEGTITISAQLPLRTNLSALGNIAMVKQYHARSSAQEARELALAMLERCGCGACGEKTDSEMTQRERFVVKLACAAMLDRPAILVDRPASMLSEIHYPGFLSEAFGHFSGHYREYVILDYAWNKPLYSGLS